MSANIVSPEEMRVGDVLYEHGQPTKPFRVTEIKNGMGTLRSARGTVWKFSASAKGMSLRSLDGLIEDHEKKLATHREARRQIELAVPV